MDSLIYEHVTTLIRLCATYMRSKVLMQHFSEQNKSWNTNMRSTRMAGRELCTLVCDIASLVKDLCCQRGSHINCRGIFFFFLYNIVMRRPAVGYFNACSQGESAKIRQTVQSVGGNCKHGRGGKFSRICLV